TVASKGYIWVEFFFALSGLHPLLCLWGRFGAGLRVGAIGAFLAARVSRLYPLQVVTLLAVAILEADRRIAESRQLGVGFFDIPIFEGRTPGTFLSNLFMVQAWGLYDILSWNAPAWFVSVEYFLCLVCPMLMLLVGARFGWRALALGGGSIAFLVALVEASGAGLDLTARHGMWRGLADFGIGLALGSLFLASRNKDGGGRPLRTSAHTLAQIGVLVAVAAALGLSGPARTPRDLMVAAPIFALIFVLAFDKGLIARALHAPGLMKLGEWSFAIYMVHYVVMCVQPALGLQESPWLACLAGIGGSIAVGALTWRFVERPLAEALRRKLLNVSGQSRAPKTPPKT
ncbi:MAG TPA: acyltransferase, partial [Candidatus Acidoferrales bacterium]|nr:acyltransferase [Candidatus Acidoferrales bacterium]